MRSATIGQMILSTSRHYSSGQDPDQSGDIMIVGLVFITYP